MNSVNNQIANPLDTAEINLGERRKNGHTYDYKTSPKVAVFFSDDTSHYFYCPFCMCVGKNYYPIGKLTALKQPYKYSRPVIHEIKKSQIQEVINDDLTLNTYFHRCKNIRHKNLGGQEDLGRFDGWIKLDVSKTSYEDGQENQLIHPKAVFSWSHYYY